SRKMAGVFVTGAVARQSYSKESVKTGRRREAPRAIRRRRRGRRRFRGVVLVRSGIVRRRIVASLWKSGRRRRCGSRRGGWGGRCRVYFVGRGNPLRGGS